MAHRVLFDAASTSRLGGACRRATLSRSPSQLAPSWTRRCIASSTSRSSTDSEAREGGAGASSSSQSQSQTRPPRSMRSTSSSGQPQSRGERIFSEAAMALGNMAAEAAATSAVASRSVAAAMPTTPPPQDLSLETASTATSAFTYTATALPPKQDALVAFFVGVLMKDGKRAMAEKHVLEMLATLSASTNRAPLPLLQQAVRSASPLVRMQTSRRGGGKIEQVPIPLNERQSTRRAIANIIDASKKRPEREISRRLAREVLAVLEGSSVAVQKREEAHKIAVANRANASVRI